MGVVELPDELVALAGAERPGLPPAPDIVIIEGAAGMGKTNLLHRFGQGMAATGAVFLSAAGASAESDIPFSTAGQLFSRPALEAGEVALAERLLRDGTFIAAARSAAHGPDALPDALPGIASCGLDSIAQEGLAALAGEGLASGGAGGLPSSDGLPSPSGGGLPAFGWDGPPPPAGWDAGPAGHACGLPAAGTGGRPGDGAGGISADGLDGIPADGLGVLRAAAPGGAAVSVPTPVFTQLEAVLLRVAGRARVVIGVDDVHHADAASLQFLLHLARSPQAAGLLLVLTEYPPTGPARRVPHTELLYSARTRRLRLGPLPRERVAALLAEYYDPATARALADEARRATGGNPRLVRALAEDGRAAGRHDGPVFGDAFRQAVLACLHRSGTTGPAEALAVLPPGSPAELHGELTGRDGEDVRRAHDLLRRTGLVEGDRFRHPAIARAVVSGMGSRAGT
ncbi:AAA family ATPase, partial [Spirillospora sp. NPDC049652]